MVSYFDRVTSNKVFENKVIRKIFRPENDELRYVITQ
jgi:hypothetical protein